jgi:hypothetical protein
MGIFSNSDKISKEFKAEQVKLLHHYHPMETDDRLTDDEKILSIEDWYRQQAISFKEEKITLAKARECIAQSNFGLRNDFPEFIRICEAHKAHLLVVTGGFSDVTATILNNLLNKDISDYPNL